MRSAYEIILLVIIAVALSFIFHMPFRSHRRTRYCDGCHFGHMEYGVNHFFEKFEAKRKLKRTIGVRVLHAIGFEGGLMLATIPMVAYAMQMSI